MAYGGGARQPARYVGAGEVLADEAQVALVMKAFAVEGDDAAAFLAAMLEAVQAERGEHGGVFAGEHAEYAALLARLVDFMIFRRSLRRRIEFQLGALCDHKVLSWKALRPALPLALDPLAEWAPTRPSGDPGYHERGRPLAAGLLPGPSRHSHR